MIPFYMKTADFTEPSDSLYYLLASNGIFLVNNNDLFRSVTVALGIAGLRSQEPVAILSFPKLPKDLIEQEYGYLPRPASFLKIGDIHSHPDTSAFFSLTDDYDDSEDGLRMVMGNLNRR